MFKQFGSRYLVLRTERIRHELFCRQGLKRYKFQIEPSQSESVVVVALELFVLLQFRRCLEYVLLLLFWKVARRQ